MRNLKKQIWEDVSHRAYSRICNNVYELPVGQVRDQVYERLFERIFKQVRALACELVVLNAKS